MRNEAREEKTSARVKKSRYFLLTFCIFVRHYIRSAPKRSKHSPMDKAHVFRQDEDHPFFKHQGCADLQGRIGRSQEVQQQWRTHGGHAEISDEIAKNHLSIIFNHESSELSEWPYWVDSSNSSDSWLKYSCGRI